MGTGGTGQPRFTPTPTRGTAQVRGLTTDLGAPHSSVHRTLKVSLPFTSFQSVLTIENKTFPTPSGHNVTSPTYLPGSLPGNQQGNPSCEASTYATRCRGKHACIHDEPREHEGETLRLITQQEDPGGGETLRAVHAAQPGQPGQPREARPMSQKQTRPRRRGERAQRQESRVRLALSLDRELRASVQSLGGPGGPRGRERWTLRDDPGPPGGQWRRVHRVRVAQASTGDPRAEPSF